MDNECFELCKEVYEKTRLGKALEFEYAIIYDDDHELTNILALYAGVDIEYVAPLYTSDYLLEKLPQKLGERGLCLYRSIGEEVSWNARYEHFAQKPQIEHRTESNTPLKALLKLVIALDESGIKL